MSQATARQGFAGNSRRLAGPRTAALVCLALMVAGPLPAGAAETDPMDPALCAYPLGPAAEDGRFATLDTGNDPEFAIVDASFAHATKTQHTVVSIWGSLFAVYDGRWRIGDGGSRHNIQVKTFNERGWNTSTEYPSNLDVKNVTPLGNALNPRAAAFDDRLWVVFGLESTHNLQTLGAPIVLRGRSADGTWGPFIEVTTPAEGLINQGPDLLVVGDRMLIAWLTTEGAIDSRDKNIKGRFFDGQTFGPIFNISVPNDGFGEGAFTLATDGDRIAAGYISQNVTSIIPSYVPKVAVVNAAGEAREATLWSENESGSYVTAVEFYGGKLYAVFDTNDAALTMQGDYDVFLRVVDPATLEFSWVTALGDASNFGDDTSAEMEVYEGRLYLNWISGDDGLVYGDDLDIVVQHFDGSAWSAPEDALADEKWPDDAQRAEFTVHQGALVLNWIELVKPPGSTTKDQRIALRVLERGPRWWDGLSATYTLLGVPGADGNVSVRINFTDAQGRPAVSPQYSVRVPGGLWMRLEGNQSSFTVNLSFNATLLQPFTALACGKPIHLEQVPPAVPPSGAKPAPGLPAWGAVMALALVGGSAVAFGGLRARRRA